MKTIAYFDKKITELAKQLLDIRTLKKREVKYIQEQIGAFKLCRTYLQSDLNEDFVKDQVKKLELYVDEKMDVFDHSHDWSKIAKPVETKLRKAYFKKWDIDHKKYQIKWLRHLLD